MHIYVSYIIFLVYFIILNSFANSCCLYLPGQVNKFGFNYTWKHTEVFAACCSFININGLSYVRSLNALSKSVVYAHLSQTYVESLLSSRVSLWFGQIVKRQWIIEFNRERWEFFTIYSDYSLIARTLISQELIIYRPL